MNTDAAPPPASTEGAKMIYLIARRPTTSREELIAHWFAHHMPPVMAAQARNRALARAYAWRYWVTLFEAEDATRHGWEGMAELWWTKQPPAPPQASGVHPRDSFQEKAEPYRPWATTEHVVVEGRDRLPLEPSARSTPFPCTRSGFLKISFLVAARPDTDYVPFFEHWLGVHVPNVRETLLGAGGLRYVVNLSREPDQEPYAGLAELYFPDSDAYRRYRETIKPDGMEQWVDRSRTPVLAGRTQLIGIP